MRSTRFAGAPLLSGRVLSPAQEPEVEFSLLDLLAVVARGRGIIAASTAVMLVLGILLFFMLPKRYTAETSFLPPKAGSSGGALFGQIESPLSFLGLKNPTELQVSLLKSRTVEDAVVDRFHLVARYHVKLQSAARGKLESVIAITNGSKNGLITLTATDADPHFAADLANGYLDEYRRNTARLAVTEASRRRLFFEQQLASAKDNLAAAEEALKNTEQRTGLIQPNGQTSAVVSSVAQLRAQIAAKQVAIQGMGSFATPENPDLQTAEKELAALKMELARIGGNDDIMVSAGHLQQASLDYIRKNRDVRYYETMYNLIARQYEAAKVDEARQGSTVEIVDRAVVPDHRSSPKLRLIVAAFAFTGFALGLILVLGREGVDSASRLRPFIGSQP